VPAELSAAPLSVGYVVKTYPRLSETFVLNEILGLEERGVRVTVLALRRPAEPRFHEKLARVRAEVLYAPEVRPSSLLEFLAARRGDLAGLETKISAMFWAALRADDADGLAALVPAIAFLSVVRKRGIARLHAHFATSATSVAMRLASLAGIGYSFTAHAKDLFHESVRAEALAEKVARADFAVAVSDRSAEHLRNVAGPAAARKVRRLYNGLDLDEFPRPDVGPSRRAPLLASVGRLVPKKGFLVLLDALAILRDEGRPITAEIIGDGEQRAELERRIASNGLAGRVTLRGAQPHGAVRDLLARASLFALPAQVADDGNRDGLPVVLVEAMASATPVVSTPVVGIPEAIDDGVTGLLVREEDARALAAAIRRLLDDPALAKRLAAAARRRVEERFDLRRSVAGLHDLFLEAEAVGAGR